MIEMVVETLFFMAFASAPIVGTKNVPAILIMIETEDTIRKLDKDVALIKQKLDILENNHLAHIKKDVDRILYILGAVGIVVLGELFVLLNAVL